MKRVVIFFCMTLLAMSCMTPKSIERQLIQTIGNDQVEDSCIMALPGDSTSTAFVNAAFAEKGVYLISNLPLSDPRMYIRIDDILRTRYSCDFEYIGAKDSYYLYRLYYSCFPKMGRYHYELLSKCTLSYYNGEGYAIDWTVEFSNEEFNRLFYKAVPYMLN